MNAKRERNKRLNHKERGLSLLKIDSLPLVAKIEVTNNCNFNCIMCGRKRGAKVEELDFEIFMKLKPLFPTLLSVYLYGIGEVLTYARLDDMISVLLSYGVNVGIITNGSLITDEKAESWVRNNLYKVSVSIDGATERTYNEIRRGGDFKKLLNNVALINKYKKKYSSDRPVLTFNFVAMRRNIRELPALVRLARDMDVAEVIVNDLIVFSDDMKDDALDYDEAVCRENFIEAKHVADSSVVSLYLPVPFKYREKYICSDSELSHGDKKRKSKRINVCTEPWSGFWLTSSGIVTPCCYWMKPMGDLKRDSFSDIWNNENYKKLRAVVNTSKRDIHCRQCAISGMERRSF